VLIAFHKPYGVLSQFTPDGSLNRPLSDFHFPKNVYSVGRLDADSEGLLLLSDEPGWNARLLEPRHAHEREYWAQVERIPTEAALEKLSRGVLIQGRKTLPGHAWLLDPQPIVATEIASPNPSAMLPTNLVPIERPPTLSASPVGDVVTAHRMGSAPMIPPRNPPIRFRKRVPDCWIGLELIEGKNRQVRRMTAAIGHPTLRLLRIRIGRFSLGDLPAGRWRILQAAERDQVAAR